MHLSILQIGKYLIRFVSVLVRGESYTVDAVQQSILRDPLQTFVAEPIVRSTLCCNSFHESQASKIHLHINWIKETETRRQVCVLFQTITIHVMVTLATYLSTRNRKRANLLRPDWLFTYLTTVWNFISKSIEATQVKLGRSSNELRVAVVKSQIVIAIIETR